MVAALLTVPDPFPKLRSTGFQMDNVSRGGVAVVVAGLTILAAVVRGIAIGHESVWIDEAVSLQLAAAPIHELVTGVKRDFGNPWGYWVVLGHWQRLFGPSIESARALSAAAGSLIVPATFLLARADGLSRTPALVAALATAVSPPLVFLGREARVYAIFAVVATLTAFAVTAVRRGQRFGLLAFVVLGAALLYLHYYAFFVLAALAPAFVWGRRPTVRELAKVCFGYLAIALAFLPALPLFLKQLGDGSTRSEGTWLIHLGAFPLYQVAGHTLVWKRTDQSVFLLVLLVVALAVFLPALMGLLRSRTAPRSSAILAVGTLAIVALVSLVSPIVNSRYLSVIVPAVLVVLVAGIDALFRDRPRLAALAAAASVALVTASLYRLYTEPHLPDWRGVAGAVTTNGPTLPVFFYDDTGRAPFSYYRPDLVRHVITVPFSVSGWEREGVFARLAAQPRGFWLALYLPYARPSEIDELTRDLSARFPGSPVVDFLGIRLLRYDPRDRG